MLILLATGQTEADLDKIFVGRSNSPYTSDGITQINDAAETLAPYNITHIYASDLYRAQEAAEAIVRTNPHTPPLTLLEELRERSAGAYEGKKYTDIRVGMSPRQYKVWERDPFEPPLHGESLVDVFDRVKPFFDSITPALINNDTILIVSHPDTIKVIIAMARNDDLLDACKIKIEHAIPYFYYGIRKSD